MRNLLSIEHILGGFAAETKKILLHELADKAAPMIGLERQNLYAALLQRERLGTTGMGGGIAVPHARLPGIDRIYGFFARLPTAIEFEAVDKQAVDLVFLLIAPDDAGSDHLEALIEVSSLLRDPDLAAQLRASSDLHHIYALLTGHLQRLAA